MAHFAELDENNVVLQVLVVANSDIEVEDVLDGLDIVRDDEQAGIDFLKGIFPDSGTWVQTSYSRTFRHRFASWGGSYDADNDRFNDPQPFPSWTMDENEPWGWIPPTPFPDEPPADWNVYQWDEGTTSWVEVAPPGVG